MKKIKMIFVMLFMIISGLMVGCGPINDIIEDLENSSSATGGKMGLEIIRCINEKDSEGLKGMFCGRIKNFSNIDAEIENLFDVIDKPIISHDPILVGGEKITHDGKIEKDFIAAGMRNVCLDGDDGVYYISFNALRVAESEDRVGISYIGVYDSEVVEKNGGYKLICSVGDCIRG